MKTKHLLILLLSIFFHGCIFEGEETKRIFGKYKLNRSESGNFYILHPSMEWVEVGLIHGTVMCLGWDDNYIICLRQNTSGVIDGWIIIDLKTGKMKGPVTLEEMLKYKMEICTPEQAWQMLK